MTILSFAINVHPSETLFFLCLGLGLIFAVFLGVAAGLSPSIQASRMELVSAIRYE
jgi:putative ABC transport system permease protein